ncbi:heme-binding protein [Halococcoides cellulosivorans]|uniref:Heme-binding protein n=1 Tax=Halococcoides cellulosivorans TaxID=1679096 RepID=A0A2R4X1I1_9EURY|nr:heme-binding protein [Halococcoides cellulosivorans]AWB27649.1 heme-binding protein [Halococcoides cellulosivorans]
MALAGWIGWGLYSSRTAESIPYEHRETIDGVELREYPETVLVETTAPNQRAAFRRLFDYISGANQGDESISMTAPVETEGGTSISMTAPVRSASADESGDGVRMAFYLPPEYGPDTAPVPTDSNVRLVVEPPKTVAVDQFSWYAPDWRVRRHARKLRATLDREGIDARSDYSLLRYNDPWTPPFMRRNEVAIDVADEGSPIEIRG